MSKVAGKQRAKSTTTSASNKRLARPALCVPEELWSNVCGDKSQHVRPRESARQLGEWLDAGGNPDGTRSANEKATILSETCLSTGNLAAVKILLSHGVNCDKTDDSGCTPLMYAAHNASIELQACKTARVVCDKICGTPPRPFAAIVLHLVRAGADVELRDRDGAGALDSLEQNTDLHLMLSHPQAVRTAKPEEYVKMCSCFEVSPDALEEAVIDIIKSRAADVMAKHLATELDELTDGDADGSGSRDTDCSAHSSLHGGEMASSSSSS